MNVSDTSHSVLFFGNTTPNENECILHLSSITNKIGYKYSKRIVSNYILWMVIKSRFNHHHKDLSVIELHCLHLWKRSFLKRIFPVEVKRKARCSSRSRLFSSFSRIQSSKVAWCIETYSTKIHLKVFFYAKMEEVKNGGATFSWWRFQWRWSLLLQY